MKYVVSFLIAAFFCTGICAQPKARLEISKLRENFYIYTTYNSYKGVLVPANGMYIVTEKGVMLFDSPWDTTQFQPLLDSIEARHHKKVVLCVATHSHEDRTGGLEYYKQKGIQTFTSLQTDQICKEKKENRAEFIFTQDTLFTLGNYSGLAYYAGPGHTPDNLVIWFEKEKVLYGGCLIKSIEAGDLGNLNDAVIGEWPATLKNIQKKCRKPLYVIPGHNSWKGKSIEHTLKLLKEYKKTN